MTSWSARWLPLALAFVGALACHDRDSVQLAGRCFAFDSAAFTEVGYDTATGAVVADSTELIELLDRPHPTEVGAFAVRAHGLRVRDDQDSGREEYSYWRPMGRDSVKIVWRDGLHGPVIQVAIRGRRLEGTLYETSDIVPSPYAGQTWHVRARSARCPHPSRPAA